MKIDSPNAIGISTGFGIPTGGTANQVLSKINGDNYNTIWKDASSPTTPFTASTNITRGYAVRLRDNGTIIATNTISGETFPIIGIAQQSGTTGSTVQVAVESSISEVHTGLLPGYNYYSDANGLITTTGDTYVGVALSSTQINVSFSNPGGITTPSLSVIDNTITNPDDITTPGRYIVPVSGNTGVFVGEANDYADYDGSSFTFSIPENGDKALITTGPNAGNVYLFTSGATSGWTLSSQSTTLPTSNWVLGVSYKQNDLVIYQNVLYQANGNIPANTAFVIGTSGLTWKQIGYGNVIPEYGSVYPTSGSTRGGAGATSYADLPGSTLNIPSAGTYRIYYNMSVTNGDAGGNTSFVITDSSNTIYNGSAGNTKEAAASTVAVMATQEIFVTFTGPASIKMRWKTNGTGTSTLVNNNTASNSVFGYEKISGFLPSTGSISTSRSATLSATIPGGGTVGTDITGVAFSVGNIPLSNSGVWTLTAGVTYQIECSVVYDAGGTNQFQGDTFIQFVDATTNTPLPNQNGASTITPFFTTRGLARNGYCIFQYTPSTNQTIKLRATFQNNAGFLTAQTFINQLGTTNVSQFLGAISNSWSNSNTYPSGALVVNNGILYQANNTILAGTGFNIGTTGNTWRAIDAVPSGGTTGQVLRKVNNTNYNTEWATPGVPLWEFPGGGPTIGGTTTAPTIGGTVFRNEQFYRQVGPRAWEVSLALDKDAGGNAGNGDYLFSLPAACPDFQNFGIQPFWTLDVASNAARLQRYAIANSYGSIHHNITPSTTVQIIAYDARRYRVLIHDEGAAIRCMGSAWFEMDKSLGLMLQFQYQSV
jgi:hypothetical protein